MYCTSCGKQIADDAAFCQYCGKATPQGDALAELVAAARIGDQGAISTLYEKTYSKVYYAVKSMIKDEDAVFDIVQDTYIKAFAHLDSFQGDIKFLPWVRQIASNTARDWLKKKRPMLFTELSPGGEQDIPVEELFPDERSENLPDQVIDQKETKRLIGEIIEELPEDQRAAIGMFYYEEMSVKEIAAAMGVSESAVKSRLMYGRNKIEKKGQGTGEAGHEALQSGSASVPAVAFPQPEGIRSGGAGQPGSPYHPCFAARGYRPGGRNREGYRCGRGGGRHWNNRNCCSRHSRCGWKPWRAEDRTYRSCRRGGWCFGRVLDCLPFR